MEVCTVSFLYDWVGENCFWPSLYQARSHSIFPPYHLLSWLLETSPFFPTHQCEGVGIDRRAGSPTVPAFPLSTGPAPGERAHSFTTLLWKVLAIFSLYLCRDLLDVWASFSLPLKSQLTQPFLREAFPVSHGTRAISPHAFTLLNSCYSLPVWTVSFSRE